MGFIESPDGGKTLAEWSSGGPGADGQPMPPGDPQITAEPGAMPVLPPGYKFNAGWNPKYPDAAIEPFVKACLRGVAVGVNVAYHNLSGDMEGVNYSSARIAELDERDSWMTLQSFVVEHLHDDLYGDWLRQSVLMGALSFELAKLERYRAVYWQARRWAWVDPEKEVNAALKAIEGNLKSRTRIVAEQGEDIEDVFDEIAAEKQLASEKKIDLGMDKPAAAATATESADAQSQTEAKQRQMVVDAVREVVMSVPAPKEPSVNVTAPITVNVPERSVEVKTGDTHVTVPERELHFEATIPQAAAPVVHVNAYPECVEETIERDADREITRITRTATH